MYTTLQISTISSVFCVHSRGDVSQMVHVCVHCSSVQTCSSANSTHTCSYIYQLPVGSSVFPSSEGLARKKNMCDECVGVLCVVVRSAATTGVGVCGM